MAIQWVSKENGTFAEFTVQDGKVHKRLFQPQRQAQLRQNQEAKRNGTRMMDWGKQVAEVPIPDLIMLRKFFGEALFSDAADPFDRRVARERFLKSPASDPYRTEYRRRQGGL